MQNYGAGRLYAATDVVGFLECEHLTTLSLQNLVTPLPVAAVDESDKLVQDKGIEHERAYVHHLMAQGLTVLDISQAAEGIAEKVEATLDAMRRGVDIIYQATLLDGPLIGFADFLVKVPRRSNLGDFSYEVSDTKLARSPKAKFLVQLAFYSRLLAVAQGTAPLMMHVVLGDKSMRSYRCADYAHYFGSLLHRFLARVEQDNVAPTYPNPCDYCDLCRWAHLCDQRRLDDDHLCQVANITRIQVAKLNAAGITRMAELAALADQDVSKVAVETLARLKAQARLQVQARSEGHGSVELLPLDAERRRGFYRLPEPNPGDMFFDMEGNPWEDGGLEYLFGLYFLEEGGWQFKGFWAHDREQERRAFEDFIDFVVQRLRSFPGAHIYHYAKYEETALKKLMSLHATREVEVDNLLRHGILVDLYQVVREAIRVSEPRYSIKNIEHFYLEAREGEVTNAGASIVWYEKWRETGERKLLDDIELYNKDDVRSTQLLRDWLVTLKPAEVPWAVAPAEQDEAAEAAMAGQLTEAEARLVAYRKALVDPLPPDRLQWGVPEHARELTYQLLDFHRRADKPLYWALFIRMDMTEEELLEDAECLAQLRADPAFPPVQDKRSFVYTYTTPSRKPSCATAVRSLARTRVPVSVS
jgi:predicted RecB family nuclease